MKKLPILYDADAVNFSSNGIGVITDAKSCKVMCELNGTYDLTMAYPITGKYLNDLKARRIIYADASKSMGMQPFRIYNISKAINGFITVYAHHISYDLNGIPVTPFEASGASDAVKKIRSNSLISNPFYFSSSVLDDTEYQMTTPRSARAALMGSKESILTAYGGEIEFDHFNIRHKKALGADNGFTVKYGVNMTDLYQEENIDSMFTGIYPFYRDQETFVEISDVDAEKILHAKGDFNFTRILPVDLTLEFDPDLEDVPPSSEQLLEKAQEYMESHEVGVPRVSIDFRFESLSRFSEYKDIPLPDDVELGDVVHVNFEKLKVWATARVISYIYDSLLHKYERVSVGDGKSNVSDTIFTLQERTKESITQIGVQKKALAKIEVRTTSNESNISAWASVSYQNYKAINSIDLRVTSTEVLVEEIGKVTDENREAINKQTTRITANEIAIDGLQTVTDGNSKAIKINSDHIDAQTISINELYGITDENSAAIVEHTARIEANEIDITDLFSVTDGQKNAIATLNTSVEADRAKIALVVETSENGQNAVKGSVLVEAINGQSTATIRADKVDLKGYVTVSSLTAKGTTEIDGSRIKTGQIVSQNFSDEYILLNSFLRQTYDPGTYFFEFNGRYISFTTENNMEVGYSVRFDDKGESVMIYDGDQLNESTQATVSESFGHGVQIDTDITAYFSETGTIIDLQTGKFVSPGFAIIDGNSYFGGNLRSDGGRIGCFEYNTLGFYSMPQNNIMLQYGAGGIFYSSQIGLTPTEYVELRLGEPLGIDIPGYSKPHRFQILSSSGDIFEISSDGSKITGSWKATPYTSAGSDPSEIVTKKDLITLGLITE